MIREHLVHGHHNRKAARLRKFVSADSKHGAAIRDANDQFAKRGVE